MLESVPMLQFVTIVAFPGMDFYSRDCELEHHVHYNANLHLFMSKNVQVSWFRFTIYDMYSISHG